MARRVPPETLYSSALTQPSNLGGALCHPWVPALTVCRDEDFHWGTERPHPSFGDSRDAHCAGGVVDTDGDLSTTAVLADVFRQLFLGMKKKGKGMTCRGATLPPEGRRPSHTPGAVACFHSFPASNQHCGLLLLASIGILTKISTEEGSDTIFFLPV